MASRFVALLKGFAGSTRRMATCELLATARVPPRLYCTQCNNQNVPRLFKIAHVSQLWHCDFLGVEANGPLGTYLCSQQRRVCKNRSARWGSRIVAYVYRSHSPQHLGERRKQNRRLYAFRDSRWRCISSELNPQSCIICCDDCSGYNLTIGYLYCDLPCD